VNVKNDENVVMKKMSNRNIRLETPIFSLTFLNIIIEFVPLLT